MPATRSGAIQKVRAGRDAAHLKSVLAQLDSRHPRHDGAGKRDDQFVGSEKTPELNGPDLDRSENPVVDGQIHDGGDSFRDSHSTPPAHGGGGMGGLVS